MKPEYLKQLADIADPDELWRRRGLDRDKFTKEQKMQLDTGVALRRYASDIERLEALIGTGKSLLITQISTSGRAFKTVDTPIEHKKYL